MDSLDSLCDLIEDYVKFTISIAKCECVGDLKHLQKILPDANSYLNVRFVF